MSASVSAIKSWAEIEKVAVERATGKALEEDEKERKKGLGLPHVHNKLRLYKSQNLNQKPKLTLYRDHAGWCPYCEKTMLLIEEKKIPINIELINMRSYGDKPREFLQLVPNGLLPALSVELNDGSKRVITESQVIMEILDDTFSEKEGYISMMPKNAKDLARHQSLARLERELFSWWCTFLFRPEQSGNFLSNLLPVTIDDEKMSPSMKGFLDCLSKVNQELESTNGPWFFDSPHPMMIDLIFVSHVERMLASVAYWKGFNIRNCGRFPSLDKWLDAFDERDAYLAFKSDFYTNVMDIPPQYGPPYFGGRENKVDEFTGIISGKDKKSWKLPLEHNEELQDLYQGPALPRVVLEANNILNQESDSKMPVACREMAAWKLSKNGPNIAKFASRGSSRGSKNPRKTFAAELADPYAAEDVDILPIVDDVLKLTCEALLEIELETPSKELEIKLSNSVPKENVNDVVNSLAYLRDRIGVPRDLPLASARYLRAYLNWSIDILHKK